WRPPLGAPLFPYTTLFRSPPSTSRRAKRSELLLSIRCPSTGSKSATDGSSPPIPHGDAPPAPRPRHRVRWSSSDRGRRAPPPPRSEEHTSELQSREKLVCR